MYEKTIYAMLDSDGEVICAFENALLAVKESEETGATWIAISLYFNN